VHGHPIAELGDVLVEHSWAEAIVHVLPVSSRFHQPGNRELLHVMRNRGLTHRETVAKPLAADFGSLGNMFENLHTARIGQGFGYPLKLLGIHVPNLT
jgi:hypothetical protein